MQQKHPQPLRARTVASPRRQAVSRPCDLMALIDIAATRVRPSLVRRGQCVKIASYDGPLSATADLVELVNAIEAGILEASSLSLAGENVRVAACEDEGDAVVTIIGCNRMSIPSNWMKIDPRLLRVAEVAGASVELFWEVGEGPTVVFRMPVRRRWGNLANDR